MAVKNPKFVLKSGKGGKTYFHLTARNGEPILQSQGYSTKSGARRGIQSVRRNAPLDERYQKREAKNGQVYFSLVAGNRQVIGTSEMYKSPAARDRGIESVKKNAPDAGVEDTSG